MPLIETQSPPPTVSIVVGTHNRQSSLDGLIDALLRLDYPPDSLEVVVVDDGSNPAAKLACGDPRFRLIRQQQQGPAAARNAGIRAAGGEFVAITDDDCRPRPDWIATLSRAYRRNPTALLGGSTVNALAGNIYAAASQALIDYLCESLDELSSVNIFLTTSNCGGARSGFLAIGGFDETFPLPAAEDRDLCDRWKANGPLLRVPQAVVEHYHRMSFRGYARQHFRYGRGARTLHRKRSQRGNSSNVEGLKFYARLFAYPFRSRSFLQGTRIAALFLVSQLANIAGYAYESFRGEETPARP